MTIVEEKKSQEHTEHTVLLSENVFVFGLY